MKLLLSLLFTFMLVFSLQAQDNLDTKETLPYHQIPEYPEDFSSGNILARLVDGLGYRYYWATEGLRIEDFDYQPSEDAANMGKTMDHLYALSTTILNAVKSSPNVRPLEYPEVDFYEKRAMTLRNLKAASDLLLNATEGDVSNMKLIFKRGEQQSEFSFWHNINGPIADAIYHTGQVVSFRRTNGNPINPKVNVFMGKTKE